MSRRPPHPRRPATTASALAGELGRLPWQTGIRILVAYHLGGLFLCLGGLLVAVANGWIGLVTSLGAAVLVVATGGPRAMARRLTGMRPWGYGAVVFVVGAQVGVVSEAVEPWAASFRLVSALHLVTQVGAVLACVVGWAMLSFGVAYEVACALTPHPVHRARRRPPRSRRAGESPPT